MQVTAHSGCDHYPDNSIEYIKYACTLPISAAEVDVCRRQDGILVISHDLEDGKRYADCPTLEQVFTICGAAHGINCDLKENGLEQEVCQMYARICAGHKLYLSGCVSMDTLKKNPALTKQAKVLLNVEEIIPQFYAQRDAAALLDFAPEIIKACKACGVDTVNIEYQACTPALQQALAAAQIGVSVWTVDTAIDAQQFAQRGVYNLTTRNTAQIASMQD